MKCHIQLAGTVGSYDFSPSYLRYAMTEYEGEDNIVIGVTSQGGSYFAAMEIVDIIRNAKKKVVCYIGSYAFSAGSFVALAAAETHIAANALLAYHRPLAMQNGGVKTPEDLRSEAEFLDKCYESYREMFSARTGMKPEEVDNLLKSTLYCTAEEALQLKLVDKILPVTRRNDGVINFEGLPERVVNFINGKDKEFDSMALKDVLNKFSIKCEDGQEETAIVNFIETLQKPVEKKAEATAYSLPKTIVNMLIKNRNMELDELARTGKATPAVVNELKVKYTTEEHIQKHTTNEGEISDAFDEVVNTLRKNEEVISFTSRSGTQQTVDPSKVAVVNELLSDMEQRSSK